MCGQYARVLTRAFCASFKPRRWHTLSAIARMIPPTKIAEAISSGRYMPTATSIGLLTCIMMDRETHQNTDEHQRPRHIAADDALRESNIIAGGTGLGDRALPAPQAGLMALLAQGIVGGNMPWPLVLVGILMGFAIIMMQVRSPMLVAVGMYLPLETTSAIFVGGIIRAIAERMSQRRALNEAQKARVENSGVFDSIGPDRRRGAARAWLGRTAVQAHLEECANRNDTSVLHNRHRRHDRPRARHDIDPAAERRQSRRAGPARSNDVKSFDAPFCGARLTAVPLTLSGADAPSARGSQPRFFDLR